MNRLMTLLAFLLGALILALMVRHTGIDPLVNTIQDGGWRILLLVAVWGLTYLCNARAWQLLILKRPSEFNLWQAWLLTVTAFGINIVTPLMSMGGEPIKMAGARRWLTRGQATGSVVGFRLLHSLAHVLVFLAAAIPAAIILPHTLPVLATIILVSFIMAALVLVLLSGHQDGLFERAVRLLGRIPGFRGLAARLQRKRHLLREFDHELTAIRRNSPGQFVRALITEVVARLISTLEFTIMLYVLGLQADPVAGFVIANVSSLITVIFFFIPFEMGVKEGGVYLIMKLLGHDPVLAASAALLSRVREVFWGAVAVLLLLVLDLRNPLSDELPEPG